MPTDVVSVIGTAPATFPEALSWETATRACVSLDLNHLGELKDEVHSVSGSVLQFLSTDVDATRRRRLRLVGAAPRTSMKRGYGARTTFRISVSENYVEITDLQITSPSSNNCVTLASGVQGVRVERCVLDGGLRGVSCPNAGVSLSVIRNNAVYGATQYGIRFADTGAGTSHEIDSNAMINCAVGLSFSSVGAASRCTVRDNVALASTTADYQLLASAAVHAANESSDASGDPGFTGQVAAAEYCNVTPGSENAFPRPGAFLLGAGVDLSASFTADALGTVRSAPWNIGPCQTVDAAGPSLTITTPSALNTFQTVLTIDLAGTASDPLSGLASVTWSNSGTGLSGACVGLESWSKLAIAVVPGVKNVITITATDVAGNVSTGIRNVWVKPVLTSVTPTYCGEVAGAVLLVDGENFAAGTVLGIGGKVGVTSALTATCFTATMPALPPGRWDAIVFNADGEVDFLTAYFQVWPVVESEGTMGGDRESVGTMHGDIEDTEV